MQCLKHCVLQPVISHPPAAAASHPTPIPPCAPTPPCSQAPPPASTEPLHWLPPTYSAIALRLATLDASVLYDPSLGCTGRDQMAGYRYVLRPPAFLPDHPEPYSLQQGLGAATFTAPVLPFGRIRPLQLMPQLPGSFMCLPQRQFSLPSEELRRSLQHSGRQPLEQETWRLRPPPLRVGGVGKTKGAAGGKAGGGGSAAAGGKGKGGTKKSAAAAKAAKNRKKSALARSLETDDSDKDYGDDYDDGLDGLIDETKYAYNTETSGARKKGGGPGQLYASDAE